MPTLHFSGALPLLLRLPHNPHSQHFLLLRLATTSARINCKEPIERATRRRHLRQLSDLDTARHQDKRVSLFHCGRMNDTQDETD